MVLRGWIGKLLGIFWKFLTGFSEALGGSWEALRDSRVSLGSFWDGWGRTIE